MSLTSSQNLELILVKSYKKINSMKKTTLIVCLLFATQCMFSQATLPASGGEATGSGGSSSYTVGQIDYIRTSGSGGTADQGVQHPITFSVLGIDAFPTIALQAVIFPNPTVHNVTLIITDLPAEALSYQLYDITRRLISSRKIIDEETIIPMEGLPVATYLLTVLDKNTQLKTFKIIKE